MSWAASNPIGNYTSKAMAQVSAAHPVKIPHRQEGAGAKLFRQMLLAYRQSSATKSKTRPSGLTAIDYLANPIPVTFSNKSPQGLNSRPTRPAYLPITGPLSPIVQKKPAADTIASRQKTNRIQRHQPVEALKSSKENRQLNENEKIEISVNKAAAKYNLPSQLIHAVIRAESNFDSKAVSTAGAQGLMQLMPATAEELGVKNPFDIDQNVDGGTRYLRKMIDQFGGDIKLALAAYNAGPGTVERYNGNVPYRETKQYVNRVLRFSREMV